jgi:cytoskeletal protein CcmA (bactofilin family)
MWGQENSDKDKGVSQPNANAVVKSQPKTGYNTLIGEGTELKGDLLFAGSLHIDGVVKGNVVAEENTDAVLTLSEHGMVEGEVRAPTMVLNGTVNGDVHSRERIELTSRARITGNIHYNLIEMAIGAEVNGQLVHRTETLKPVLAVDREADALRQGQRNKQG